MNLLKIIVLIFIIYFIRRFIQLYQVLKSIQLKQEENLKNTPSKKDDAIDTDYKVL
jgi:hypothetical protein